MTAVMSAANEKAVEVFLREEIAYLDIVPLVSACCEAHKADLTAAPSIDDIVHFDAWARDWCDSEEFPLHHELAEVSLQAVCARMEDGMPISGAVSSAAFQTLCAML